MRVADEDRQLTTRELENIILHKHKDAIRWDNEPCDAEILSPEMLDTEKIRRFVERAGLTWDNATNALDKLGLHKNGQLLNATKLFFASEPPLQLRCAVFATTSSSTIIDRHDFDGDILELIEKAQKYILANIHIGMRLDGLYRVDVPEIPMAALREAIINAFCHRDYRDPDFVQIAIFRNRVEVRNPGTLYDGLTIEEMRQGNVSRRRNPLIADLFRRIRMVEGWGRGMPLILENAPTVQFRQTAGLFIASFERPSYGEASGKETVDKTVDKVVMTERETELCRLVHQNPNITQNEMANLLGLTERGVRYLTDKLQKQGVLLRIGGKKAGIWKVIDTESSWRAGI
jgi:ATP-dependent DNA helicase RecG